jgi:hypothetical protein
MLLGTTPALAGCGSHSRSGTAAAASAASTGPLPCPSTAPPTSVTGWGQQPIRGREDDWTGIATRPHRTIARGAAVSRRAGGCASTVSPLGHSSEGPAGTDRRGLHTERSWSNRNSQSRRRSATTGRVPESVGVWTSPELGAAGLPPRFLPSARRSRRPFGSHRQKPSRKGPPYPPIHATPSPHRDEVFRHCPAASHPKSHGSGRADEQTYGGPPTDCAVSDERPLALARQVGSCAFWSHRDAGRSRVRMERVAPRTHDHCLGPVPHAQGAHVMAPCAR